tara:strand:+ start:37 stop:447 length:411 start_codon:yes stop_codon:yes gene_type:complete
MQKYLKPSVFILSTIPFLVILYKIFLNKLGPEPVKEITHFTGEWTLIFLCLTLSMSPLKRLTNLSVWVSFRRTLGLFVFFYATLHLLTYVGLDYRFDWQPILDDVVKKKIYIYWFCCMAIINSFGDYLIKKNGKVT